MFGTANAQPPERDGPSESARLRRELDEFRYFLPDALMEVDLATGLISYLNRMATILLGYTEEDLAAGVSGFALLDDEGRRTVEAGFARTIGRVPPGAPYQRTGTQDLMELDFRHRDGAVFPVEVQGSYVLDAGGQPRALRFIFRDISARRAIEEDLRRNDERLRLLAAHAPVILFALDAGGVVTLCQGKALDLVGAHGDRVVGRCVHELLGDHPEVLDLCTRALEGHSGAIQHAFGARLLDIRVEAVRSPDGAVTGVVGVATDVTDLEAAARAVAHSQKMESLGILASGIAHDFNNILTTVLGVVGVLERSPALTPGDRDHVELISLAAHRGAEVTGRLLAFARGGAGVFHRMDLRQAISDAVRLARPAMPLDTCLDVVLPADPVEVEAEPAQLEQAVLNLIINARDALGPGGCVQVALTAGPATARLSIKDDGAGMDPATRARLFEPFFTTKPSGSGTGLGTSIAYSLIKSHGGDIEVQSEVGAGAEFTITLPLARP